MKSNRREFLKMSGLAGVGLTGASLLAGCSTASGETSTNLDHIRQQASRKYSQQFNMHGYAAPALDVVRVGVTGVGNRGSGTVRRLASIEGVEIKEIGRASCRERVEIEVVDDDTKKKRKEDEGESRAK